MFGLRIVVVPDKNATPDRTIDENHESRNNRSAGLVGSQIPNQEGQIFFRILST